MKLKLAILIIALALTGCESLASLKPATPTLEPTPTPPPTCAVQSEEFIEEITSLQMEWADALQLASSTSRIALSPAVANLQSIRRRTEALEPPECSRFVEYYLKKHMDSTIDAFLIFMANESESEMNDKMEQASKDLSSYLNELESVMER